MGKVALITGAGRGIGHGIAKALAAEGYDIVVMDIHEESVVADAMNEIEALGVQALYARGDVTKPEDRAQALQATRDRFGALNVLVNNAGVGPGCGTTSPGHRGRVRVGDAHQPAGPLLSHPGRGELDGGTAAGRSRLAGLHRERLSMSATGNPRTGAILHLQGGVSHGHQLWAARMGEFGIPVYASAPGIIKTR